MRNYPLAKEKIRKIKVVFSHRGLSAVRAPVSMRCESSMEEQACHDISLAAVDLRVS